MHKQKILEGDIAKYVGMVGSLAGTTVTWLFGDIDTGIEILTTTMALDYALGVMWGYKSHQLNSKVAFSGLKKKLTVIFILAFAVQLDKMLGQGWIFRTLVVYFYTTMEGLSIIETAAKFGVPIPDKLKEALVQLNEDYNKGDFNNENKEGHNTK